MNNVRDLARMKYEGRFIDSDSMQPVDPDDGIPVEFYMAEVQNEEASTAACRPIYEQREYIRKHTPDDQFSIVDRPVREEDLRTFAAAYKAFKSEQSEVVTGTPLEICPAVTRCQVKELAHLGIRTMEQLAAVDDKTRESFGQLAPLRDQARSWLAVASGAASAQQARAESDALRRELEELKQQLAVKPKRARSKSTGKKPVAAKKEQQ